MSIIAHALALFYLWHEFTHQEPGAYKVVVQVELIAMHQSSPPGSAKVKGVANHNAQISQEQHLPISKKRRESSRIVTPDPVQPAVTGSSKASLKTPAGESSALAVKHLRPDSNKNPADSPETLEFASEQSESRPSAAMNTTVPSLSSGDRSNEKRRLEMMRKHLEAHKFYPASARRRGIEGDVEIGFDLDGEGHADGIAVVAGSGYAVLDHAAVKTVMQAQPFPVHGGTYSFRLRFRRL